MDHRAWDARYAATDLVWGSGPNRWVAQEVAGLVPGRALDLAAGEGRNALWLAAAGWRVTAVDFSAVALERGRSLAAAQPAAPAAPVEWVRADVRTYQPEDGGYDLVLLCYLQLPAADRRAVLRHAAGALALGGTLLVVGHDTTNLTEGVGGPQDPSVLFTPDDITADLADLAGPSGIRLRTVRAERVRRPVPVGDGHGHGRGHDRGDEGGTPPGREAIDALVRLQRS